MSLFQGYYVYSINHGQESALDGRVRTHELTVAFLHNHVRYTHATSPKSHGHAA